jgi:hypothetical protein
MRKLTICCLACVMLSGCTTGNPLSPAESFQPPVPTSPVNSATVTTARPTLAWNNAPRNGTPKGTVVYEVQVSDNSAFATPTGTSVNETPGATTVGSPADGGVGVMSFWRVRATDMVTVGPWSATGSFVYVLAAAAPPAAAPPASGGGNVGADLTSWWNPADPQGSWMGLVQGKTPNSATLVSLGPYLVAIGGRLENPNAAGITSKIILPSGKIVRVGDHFDPPPFLPMGWTWVPQN